MSDKINVIFLINYAGSGGSEKYLKILCENLKDKINPILVYNEEGLLAREFKEMNIKTIRLKMRHPFDFFAARKLAKIAKENNVQIIHSNYLRENYISIFAKRYLKTLNIVYTCHFNLFDNWIVTLLNKHFYKKLDKIIAISNEVKKSLIASGSKEEKIEIIYHGVEKKDIVSPIKEAKEKFDIKEDELVISSASRFSPEKGNEFFIKSIGVLNEKMKIENCNVKYKVLLANEGITLDDCKTLCDILNLNDVIKFVGFQKDMKDFYLSSDIYVTSSISEGLGFSCLESLSYGIPNVVTKAGGIVEIVNEETKCGFSIPYGNEIDFADGLYTLLTDENKRNEMKENALKVINEKFLLQTMIEKTFNVYNKLLNKSSL